MITLVFSDFPWPCKYCPGLLPSVWSHHHIAFGVPLIFSCVNRPTPGPNPPRPNAIPMRLPPLSLPPMPAVQSTLLRGKPNHPVWFRAGRFVRFMTEQRPDEITHADVSNAAVSRHLAFYQTTRGVAFPNQVLSERPDPNMIPGKSGAEE